MSGSPPTVIVLEDDLSIREAMSSLLRSVGLTTILYGSVQDFTAATLPDGPSCLVLDIRLPGKSGLDLQDELRLRQISLPIIFITGHGDIAMSVRAMKAGAVEFLVKPFRDQDLLDAINLAIARDTTRRKTAAELENLTARFEKLTPRERQVLLMVCSGLLNKQIAGSIGVSEITVKVHRGQVMRKMEARSVAELVRLVDRLGMLPSRSN
jgi:FixJ family two-component response regulator